MLRQSERAPGLLVGDGVTLPESVEIGGNVVVHSGTVIGEGARLQDNAVIGKPVVLGARSGASREAPRPTEVGAGAAICAGAVVIAGARIGAGTVIGDQAHVRERAEIGERTVIGRGSAVDNDVRIGDRVRVQTGCYITAFSTIEDDVFVGPCVTTTNDNTMSRHGPEMSLRGATFRRACRVGSGSVILPGIEVGEEAFVAAGSLVTRDVAARTVVMGLPAKPLREVPDADLIEQWS